MRAWCICMYLSLLALSSLSTAKYVTNVTRCRTTVLLWFTVMERFYPLSCNSHAGLVNDEKQCSVHMLNAGTTSNMG
jgi:hypothetical protein